MRDFGLAPIGPVRQTEIDKFNSEILILDLAQHDHTRFQTARE